jgi:hypothetical protein
MRAKSVSFLDRSGAAARYHAHALDNWPQSCEEDSVLEVGFQNVSWYRKMGASLPLAIGKPDI